MTLPHRFAPACLALAVAFATPVVAGCGDNTRPDPVIVQPTLASIQAEVFLKSCTFSSCHNDTKRHSALDNEIMSMLTETESCASLIGVPSKRVVGRFRVIPGDPDKSYLVDKLENRIDPADRAKLDPTTGEGRAMPWSNTTADKALLLDVQKRGAIFEWIRLGTPGCTVPDGGPSDGGDAGPSDGGMDGGIPDSSVD